MSKTRIRITIDIETQTDIVDGVVDTARHCFSVLNKSMDEDRIGSSIRMQVVRDRALVLMKEEQR